MTRKETIEIIKPKAGSLERKIKINPYQIDGEKSIITTHTEMKWIIISCQGLQKEHNMHIYFKQLYAIEFVMITFL